MQKNVVRRATVPVAAAAAMVASLLSGGVANALPAGKYVAFGDSFPANPGQSDPAVPGRGGCPISSSNIGKHVAEQAGLELHDYSCNGTTVFIPNQPQKSVIGQVDNAIAQGSLGPDTQLATFFVGANDTMQASILPVPLQDDLYVKNLTEAIRKAQAVAPQARIMVIGYPAFTSADETHYACPINANGFAPHIPAGLLHTVEMNLQNRQQRAAAETGVGFVNLKEVSHIDVAMCGKDGERQVSAILDSDTASYNMTNHPTFHGSQVMGTTIANVYKSTF